MLDQRKKFWDPMIVDLRDKSGSQKKLKKILKAVNFFGVFITCLGIVYTTYCFCLSMPPIKSWLPRNHILQTIILSTEGIFFSYSCVSVFAFNTLFIGFCINMCVQYRLISYRLENAFESSENIQQIREELRLIIEHHVFVLEYIH